MKRHPWSRRLRPTRHPTLSPLRHPWPRRCRPPRVLEVGRTSEVTVKGLDPQIASWRFPIPKKPDDQPAQARFSIQFALSPD